MLWRTKERTQPRQTPTAPEMIITLLMWSLVVAAVIQPTARNTLVAITFAGLTLISDHYLRHLDGFAYFFSDLLVYSMIVIFLRQIRPINSLNFQLQVLSFLAIIVDFYGWVAWTLSLSPTAYNLMFIAIYGCALITLTTLRGWQCVGFHTFHHRSNRIRNIHH